MIQIFSDFQFVSIPVHHTEVAIYTRDYCIDKQGNIHHRFPHGDVYEYGDLIIETPNRKYVFRRVYAAYQYCEDIIQKIRKHQGQGVITIDLDEDFPGQPFRAEEGLAVIPNRIPEET